eukprot:3556834-Pyramimonas_sp.AAC.1
MTELLLEKTPCHKALARTWSCDPRTVRRVRDVVAEAYLATEVMMWGWLLNCLRARPPDWCVRSCLWDETGQRLVLAPVAELGSSSQMATWQVLVSRIRFAWGWFSPGRPTSQHPVMSYEPVMPPIPLIPNAAPHIYSGLFRVGTPFKTCVQDLRK